MARGKLWISKTTHPQLAVRQLQDVYFKIYNTVLYRSIAVTAKSFMIHDWRHSKYTNTIAPSIYTYYWLQNEHFERNMKSIGVASESGRVAGVYRFGIWLISAKHHAQLYAT